MQRWPPLGMLPLARINPLIVMLVLIYQRQTCSRFCRYVEPPRIIRGSQSSGPRTTFFARNPIITVTEHTPTPSPEYMRRQVSANRCPLLVSPLMVPGVRAPLILNWMH